MDESATPRDPSALHPELQDAERVLTETLGEVCATRPEQADTGELIRIDETLAIASEAAKKAVSIRRRLHQERGTSARSPRPAKRSSGGHSVAKEEASRAPLQGEHRTFRDSSGVTWSVLAVQPQTTGTRRARLRGSFAVGWLAFVCEHEKRRLSPVPEGWERLDDVGLERLCAQAEVARRETATRRGPAVDRS